MNKNHEGYHDPTACMAIRRVSKKRKAKKRTTDPLMYKIGELKAFQAVAKA